MRKLVIALSALAVAIPATVTIPSAADARHRYSSRYYHRHRICRHSPGTTGLVAGGVGGAVAGQSVLGHGLLGTVAGGVGGALAGRAIDRTITARRRCR